MNAQLNVPVCAAKTNRRILVCYVIKNAKKEKRYKLNKKLFLSRCDLNDNGSI